MMTREEAIQNIKKLIGFSDTLDESISTLFPELKESEDERIRKGIISGMKALQEKGKYTFADIPMDNVFAWLEKQKEQKPVDLENEAVAFCFDNGINVTPYQATRIAHYFYELGMKEQTKKQ